MAYIGEGEDISDRIRNHDTKKDWWTTAILIASAANNLNKAHVKYLEARLIEEARTVSRITLENGNTPSRPGLSEAQGAEIDFRGPGQETQIQKRATVSAPSGKQDVIAFRGCH